ncbi:hypothetical protein [Sphingopyxis sp. 550A]
MRVQFEPQFGGRAMEDRDAKLELLDLGAISAQTRGLEPVGPVEEDTGSRYIPFAGIGEYD